MSQITDKINNNNSKKKKKKEDIVRHGNCGDSHVFDWDVGYDAPYSEHLCE